MIINMNASADFRVTAWPKASDSYNVFFQQDKMKYNLVPLVDYLSDCLFNVGKTFVRRSTFTLVNATNPLSNLSFGTNTAPHPKLRRLHKLFFTFAFTADSIYDASVYPRFTLAPHLNVLLWGFDMYKATNFMTIGIPHTVMREIGISTTSLRELQWLYMFIGAFTKNFALRNEWYSPNTTEFNDTVTYKPSLHYVSVPMLFKRFAYPDWIYSARAWEVMANALHPSAATEKFCDFYCRNLLKFWRKSTTPNVVEIERKVWSHIHGEVLKVAANGSSDLVDYMRANKQLPEIENVEAFTRALMEGV